MTSSTTNARARGVLTNTCTMAPYRGVSRPVITFALERLMDKAAAALGIDPVEIRRRNLIDTFPYTSATGLVFDEASYQQTLEMAVKAVDVPAFRERQKEARAKGRHLGIGFATFSERTGYGSPAFAARGMEITPGWETVIVTRRSVRLRRGAHRLLAARPGPAHHAGADHRRRDRRHARHDQGRARRHRPRALWLGHLRQPLAGDLRRRHADRRAQGARQADQDRQPYAGSGGRRHRAGGRRAPRSPAPTAPSPSPRWRARPTRRRTASKARSSPA